MLQKQYGIILTFLDEPHETFQHILESVLETLIKVTKCNIMLLPSQCNKEEGKLCPVVLERQLNSGHNQILSQSFFPFLQSLLQDIQNDTRENSHISNDFVMFISLIGLCFTVDIVPNSQALFTLGHADPSSSVAVVSYHRPLLYIQSQPMAVIPLLSIDCGFAKLILHEIGHTVGLQHCTKKCSECRMSPTPNVAMLFTDETSLTFCETCKYQFDTYVSEHVTNAFTMS